MMIRYIVGIEAFLDLFHLSDRVLPYRHFQIFTLDFTDPMFTRDTPTQRDDLFTDFKDGRSVGLPPT